MQVSMATFENLKGQFGEDSSGITAEEFSFLNDDEINILLLKVKSFRDKGKLRLCLRHFRKEKLRGQRKDEKDLAGMSS